MHIQLITGLGNFDSRYHGTRHNIGFAFLDQLASRHQLTWKKHPNAHGNSCTWQHPCGKIILFKPTKLMNINGGPIAQCLHYHKISPDNMLVAYDDMAFPVGTVKLKEKGGHGGHNGIRDILLHTSTPNFARLRFGIDRPHDKHFVSSYVLSRPTPEESRILEKTVADSIENIDNIIERRWQKFIEAMQ